IEGVAWSSDGQRLASVGRESVIRVWTYQQNVPQVSTGPTALVVGGGAKLPPAPAADVKLESPAALCFDKAGNMYLAGADGPKVLKVDAKGTVTVFAGMNEKGDSGDGGPALNAKFGGINGLAALPDGGLCVADTLNNRLRRVDLQTGQVTALAGT